MRRALWLVRRRADVANDKLAKVVQRTKLIKEKLTAADHGHLQIQSAIVTPLSRNKVAANLDTAGKHHIAVICKENVEELLTQVSLLEPLARGSGDRKLPRKPARRFLHPARSQAPISIAWHS